MQAAAPGQEKSEPHFCKNRIFPPASPFSSHTAGAGPHRASPGRGHGGIPRRRDAPGTGDHRAGGARDTGAAAPALQGKPRPWQAEPRRRRLLLPAQGVRDQRGSLRPGRTLSPGCLFKFGEVGPTPSKGAWGFGVNPCQASQQTLLRRGSPSVKAVGHPGARDRAAGDEPGPRTGTNPSGAARSPRAELAAASWGGQARF